MSFKAQLMLIESLDKAGIKAIPDEDLRRVARQTEEFTRSAKQLASRYESLKDRVKQEVRRRNGQSVKPQHLREPKHQEND